MGAVAVKVADAEAEEEEEKDIKLNVQKEEQGRGISRVKRVGAAVEDALSSAEGFLSLRELNLAGILAGAAPLLASGGEEFDPPRATAAEMAKEDASARGRRLAAARQVWNGREAQWGVSGGRRMRNVLKRCLAISITMLALVVFFFWLVC